MGYGYVKDIQGVIKGIADVLDCDCEINFVMRDTGERI